MIGVGDDDVDAAFGDAFGESTSEDVGGFDDVDAEAAAQAEALATASVTGYGGYGVSFDPETDAGTPTIADYDIETFKAYPQLNPYRDPNFEPTMKIGDVLIQGITDKGQAYQDEQDALQGMNWGDTQHSDGATFPSMYNTVEPPPVTPTPIFLPSPPTPSYNPGPQNYLDTIISNFTNPEKRNYLVSQRRMNMPLTEGYYDRRGNYQSLRQMFPDVFSADFVEVASPTQMAYGGLATNDQNRLRAIQQVYGQPQATGIRSLSPNRQYAQGGNVMRNIRDEEARVIGVQDDAADQMNRIRYHSGRDARDERFRVAARERDAREEMGRLRGEARYQGARAFNQGGVASLAPVARNMFRKRRLPRAGMVA